MNTPSNFSQAIVEDPDMGITMPDGCRLSARVWMPVDARDNPVPAILEYIPYRKRDGTLPRDETMHPHWAGHGYATVRVDMRGNGDSHGLMEDEYTVQELQDACDVIAWLADQPWCSGKVGMMGKSWGGFNGLQTAALNPPALGAVISVCSSADRFADDIHFRGGCLLGENIGWGAVMLSFSSRPPDPALRPDWRELWLDRLENEPFLAPKWASHQERDEYWKHGSICEDFSAVKAPVLSFGGWADNYMNTVDKLVRNLSAPVKGIVGPWVHQYPHMATPEPRIDFLSVALRWWDRWLKDVPNGAEDDPAYRAYMLDSEPPNASPTARKGVWVSEAVWPSDRVMSKTLALSDAGLFERTGPLTRKVNTPQHLGLHTGEFFPMGSNAEMPGDQAEDDAMSVCFDTAPLDAPLPLLGGAELRLSLTCDQPKAFVVARLCDVAPDGSSVRICHGMLNLCHRDSMETPSELPVGQEFDAVFQLDQMAYRLAKGHRLRLALSTTYWPFIWPSAEPATLGLNAGEIVLPVHPGAEKDEVHFDPPVSSPTWNHSELIPAHAERKSETDMLTGTRKLTVITVEPKCENLDHGLITSETNSEVWTIHPDDPLSANVVFEWVQTLERGDWSVKTVATVTMGADKNSLIMSAKLIAYDKTSEIFSRNFNESVARRFV